MRKQMWWSLLFAALAMMACGEQRSTEATVLPLEEMPGGFEGRT